MMAYRVIPHLKDIYNLNILEQKCINVFFGMYNLGEIDLNLSISLTYQTHNDAKKIMFQRQPWPKWRPDKV